MKAQDTATLENEIGHRFERRELLEQALTHSSHAREKQAQAGENGDSRVEDNEQLEFLGDAILGFVTSESLLERFPQFREGQLSKLRAHLVSEKHLIRAAKQLHLGKYLRLGKGEEKSGGRSKTALLVDALEAVLAAMYLDSGIEDVREFILETIVAPELKRLNKQTVNGFPVTDYKSALQEAAHSSARLQPSYVLVKEEGPEHRKTFTVEARIHGHGTHAKVEYVGRGEGPTKKKAEQDAARDAIEYLWSLDKAAEKGRKKKRGSQAAK
jgi:ribonuclease III